MTQLGRYSDKKVLVLGGAGFIGSHLCKAFVEEGAKVVVVDSLHSEAGGRTRHIEPLLQTLEFYAQSLQELGNLESLLEASHLIVDCMGLTAHHVGVAKPALDLVLNLTSHVHLIKALEGLPDKKVIYLGTRGQYGRALGTIDEDTAQVPLDPQGIHKAAAENHFRIYANRFGYDVVSLRLTNCYGEHQPVKGPDIGLIGSFIRQLIDGQPVEIYGSDQRTKNLLYVGDAVETIVAMGCTNFVGFSAYNVGGADYTLEQILKQLTDLVGGSYSTKPFPEEVQAIDVGEAIFADGPVRAVTGVTERTSLGVALRLTTDYFKKELQ